MKKNPFLMCGERYDFSKLNADQKEIILSAVEDFLTEVDFDDFTFHVLDYAWQKAETHETCDTIPFQLQRQYHWLLSKLDTLSATPSVA